MTEAELRAIKARLAAATPGPWVLHFGRVHALAPSGLIDEVVAKVREEATLFTDGRLIANAPTDIAALIAEVERLWAFNSNEENDE